VMTYYRPYPRSAPAIWRRVPGSPLRPGLEGLGDAAGDFFSGASAWISSPLQSLVTLPVSLTSLYSGGVIDWVSVGNVAVPVLGVILLASLMGGGRKRKRR
jgi:hypothetical protein